MGIDGEWIWFWFAAWGVFVWFLGVYVFGPINAKLAKRFATPIIADGVRQALSDSGSADQKDTLARAVEQVPGAKRIEITDADGNKRVFVEETPAATE